MSLVGFASTSFQRRTERQKPVGAGIFRVVDQLPPPRRAASRYAFAAQAGSAQPGPAGERGASTIAKSCEQTVAVAPLATLSEGGLEEAQRTARALGFCPLPTAALFTAASAAGKGVSCVSEGRHEQCKTESQQLLKQLRQLRLDGERLVAALQQPSSCLAASPQGTGHLTSPMTPTLEPPCTSSMVPSHAVHTPVSRGTLPAAADGAVALTESSTPRGALDVARSPQSGWDTSRKGWGSRRQRKSPAPPSPPALALQRHVLARLERLRDLQQQGQQLVAALGCKTNLSWPSTTALLAYEPDHWVATTVCSGISGVC